MGDDALIGLLVYSLALSLLLVLVSSAALGRKLADLEYQQAAGINGIRSIQAWVNVRVNTNRVLLGLAFIVFTTLLLADAPVDLRTWAFRALFSVMLSSFAASSVLDWMADRKQLRLSLTQERVVRTDREALAVEAEERRESDSSSDRESFRQMADAAIANLEDAANEVRAARGEPPLPVVAPVIPEHSSPTTERQQATAAVATMRSRLVAASLALGIPVDPKQGQGEP